ncbi:MAG: hypothetical protein LUD27_04995 [Clostridia bacterium]|nr:hypothetical protein [Clostridia bacterium]
MRVFCVIIAALAAMCFSIPTAYSASAENSAYVYARAEVTNAYICSEADSTTALFAIPYTYSVQVISEYGMWYYVKYAEDTGPYQSVYGYVLQSRLTLLDETPEVSWLYYTLTVTYSQGTSGNLPHLSDITATAAFYGNYYSGQSGYSYVYCQGSFGYIAGSIEDYEIIEIHSSDEDSASASGDKTADGKIIAGVVLGVLSVAALALIFMSGKKGKYKKPDDG